MIMREYPEAFASLPEVPSPDEAPPKTVQETARCGTCRQDKPRAAFYRSQLKPGRTPMCKVCHLMGRELKTHAITGKGWRRMICESIAVHRADKDGGL